LINFRPIVNEVSIREDELIKNAERGKRLANPYHLDDCSNSVSLEDYPVLSFFDNIGRTVNESQSAPYKAITRIIRLDSTLGTLVDGLESKMSENVSYESFMGALTIAQKLINKSFEVSGNIIDYCFGNKTFLFLAEPDFPLICWG